MFELEYLIFVKDSTVKCFFLMCNNCSADRITCNINSSTEHIKNTVDTHNQGNSLGIAVDLARLAVNGNYPEFVEDYELYKERMGAK